MTRFLFLLALLCLVTTARAGDQTGALTALDSSTPDDLLPPEELLEDLEELEQELTERHSGLHRYTTPEQLEHAFARARGQLDRPMDELAFYRVLAPLVSAIRCGHTQVRPSDQTLRALQKGSRRLPLELRFLRGRAFVTDSDTDEVEPGSELLAIDGRPIVEIRDQLMASAYGDGFIETKRLREVERRFAYSYALHVEANPTDFRLTLRPPGQEEVRETTVAALVFTDRGQGARREGPLLKLEIEQAEGIAVLTIRTFSSGAMSQWNLNYETFLATSFEELADAGIERLIVDIRGNTGGDDGYGALLISYLCPHEFGYFDNIQVTADYEGIGDIEDREDGKRYVTAHPCLQIQQPSEHAFDGEIALLIDGDTFSTAADVATVAHFLGLATFVGQETGGGYDGNTSGNSSQLVLTNSGCKVGIPMWMYTTANIGHEFYGRGVIPDHEVTLTIEDLLDGTDREMELALKILAGD